MTEALNPRTTRRTREDIAQARSSGFPQHVGNIKRDPIKLLEASSAGRVERLVPLRYGRMLASPFAFYRGSAAIQAHDLATTPNTGLMHADLRRRTSDEFRRLCHTRAQSGFRHKRF